LQLVGLVDQVRVVRPRGRPRTRVRHLTGDKAYGSRANRQALRARRIGHTIPERDDQKANRACKGAAGGRPPAFDRDRYRQRNQVEMVCTQVTELRLGAARGGWDHVADLHLAVGHHHSIDQQFHQLAAPLEAGLVKAHPELLQHRCHRLGDRAHLDQSLALSGDLPLARQQVGLLPGKAPVLPLEAGQIDHLGQVGLQQPLALACHAGPHAA